MTVIQRGPSGQVSRANDGCGESEQGSGGDDEQRESHGDLPLSDVLNDVDADGPAYRIPLHRPPAV